VTDDRRTHDEQRSIIQTSVRRGLSWGLFWGIFAAPHAPSFGSGVELFARRFLVFGSLVLVGTPRKIAHERADDATADLAGVSMPLDRLKVVRTTKRIIKDGDLPVDPSTRSIVLARADILRRRPALDRAALWIPVVWVVVYVGIAAHRVNSGHVGKALSTAFILLVLAVWLFRRWQYHRTMRGAVATYSKLESLPGAAFEAPRSSAAGPRYKSQLKFDSANFARPVWLVFGPDAIHVLGRHFTPSNIAIRYDDVACAQSIRRKSFGVTLQRQIRLLDARSEWLLSTRQPETLLATLRAKGVPVHVGRLNVSARQLSFGRGEQLSVAPHAACRALRFDHLEPGPS
jgi:hypothetical protein